MGAFRRRAGGLARNYDEDLVQVCLGDGKVRRNGGLGVTSRRFV